MRPHPIERAISRLQLTSEASSVSWARLHADDVLKRWGVAPEVTQNARLVISELATNAVRHARSEAQVPCFVLTLHRVAAHLFIYVYDDDRRPPAMGTPEWDETGGRGLHLVEELSDAWGYLHPTPTSGKVVWARLPL